MNWLGGNDLLVGRRTLIVAITHEVEATFFQTIVNPDARRQKPMLDSKFALGKAQYSSMTLPWMEMPNQMSSDSYTVHLTVNPAMPNASYTLHGMGPRNQCLALAWANNMLISSETV